MPITPEQKVRAQDTVPTTRYLNKEYKNWNGGRQTDPTVTFEHKSESAYYDAKFENGDRYHVLYYSNKPYLQSARLKNEDGSIMTVNRVEGGQMDTRYECDADDDGVVDYAFYLDYDDDGHLISYKEDENGDGEFDTDASIQYENGKLKSRHSVTRNPETGKLMSESSSQFFGQDPWYHKGEQEKVTFYDSKGEKAFSTVEFYDEAGRILERVYNDYRDNDFWSKVLGKSNDYRIEYDYGIQTANYYDKNGKLIKSVGFDNDNIPL